MPVILVVGLLVVAVIVAGVFFFINRDDEEEPNDNTTTQPVDGENQPDKPNGEAPTQPVDGENQSSSPEIETIKQKINEVQANLDNLGSDILATIEAGCGSDLAAFNTKVVGLNETYASIMLALGSVITSEEPPADASQQDINDVEVLMNNLNERITAFGEEEIDQLAQFSGVCNA